jgi:hypothetical protein
LESSEEAQEAEQKSRWKRKQIRSTANPRSTPAPRKKNRTARSPSEEVRRVGESEQVRSRRTERKPDGRRSELTAHHNQTLLVSHGSEGRRREEAPTLAFIGHGFRNGEGREEVSLLPREPAKATRRRRFAPENRPPSAALSRALALR